MNNHTTSKIEANKNRVIALAFASFIVFGISGSLLGIAWPSMQEKFGVSLDSFGLLLVAPTIAALVASFFSGRIIVRLGNAVTLMIACALIGLGLIAYGVSPSWTSLLVLGALLGGGSGLLDASMNAYFAGAFGPRLMNWLHAAFGVGATIGPIIMTAVFAAGLTWEWGYVVVGFVTLTVSMMYIATRKDWALQYSSESVESQQAIVVPPLRTTLRQPLVWVGIMLFFLFAGVEITAGNWAYSLFTQSRGVDAAQAGVWVSLYWGVFTLGRIVFGAFANRFDPMAVVRWCIIGAIAGALVLWWNPVNAVGFIGLAIMGFAQAPIFPLMVSTTPNRLGRGHSANAIGFQVGAAGLGIAMVPGMAGVLAGSAGLETIAPFLVVMLGITLVLYQLAGSRKIETEIRRIPLPVGAASEDALP